MKLVQVYALDGASDLHDFRQPIRITTRWKLPTKPFKTRNRLAAREGCQRASQTKSPAGSLPRWVYCPMPR